MPDSNQLLEASQNKLAQAYAGPGGEAALSPAIIQLLIDLGVGLLKGLLGSAGGGGGTGICSGLLGGVLGGGGGGGTGGTAGAPTGGGTSGAQYLIAQAKNPSAYGQLVVRAHVRRELRDHYGLGAWNRYDGPRLTTTLMKAGASSTPEEIQNLIDLPM